MTTDEPGSGASSFPDDTGVTAAARMRREREVVEARTRTLEALLARRTVLANRLEATLADARAERRAIDSELAAVLTGSPEPAGG